MWLTGYKKLLLGLGSEIKFCWKTFKIHFGLVNLGFKAVGATVEVDLCIEFYTLHWI